MSKVVSILCPRLSVFCVQGCQCPAPPCSVALQVPWEGPLVTRQPLAATLLTPCTGATLGPHWSHTGLHTRATLGPHWLTHWGNTGATLGSLWLPHWGHFTHSLSSLGLCIMVRLVSEAAGICQILNSFQNTNT